MKRPYIKLYVNDFFSSPKVRQMNVIQKGMLLLLLMEASQTKCICLPDDEKQLAKLIGMPVDEFTEHFAVVKACFAVKKEKLHNEKLKLVLKDYDDVVKANKLKGQLSAESRRNKKLTAVEQQLNQEEEKVKEEKEIKLKEKPKLKVEIKTKPLPIIRSTNVSIKDLIERADNTMRLQNGQSVKQLDEYEEKRRLIELVEKEGLLPIFTSLLNCDEEKAINVQNQFYFAMYKEDKLHNDKVLYIDDCIKWCRINGKNALKDGILGNTAH